VVRTLKRTLASQFTRTGKKNANEHQWVQEALAEMELIVDSCEPPIQRPGEYEEQKKFYSGKKKNHRKTNLLLLLMGGK
jgi:hypothetical protein